MDENKNISAAADDMNESIKTMSSLKYRGRLSQISIYLGKNFRSFIYMNGWKVVPMTAIMTLVVSVVIKSGFVVNMEGTLKGGLAIVCIALWNGFFNSIQVVCRERGIVKREHRSGMHITSYIIAHMVYQAFLCILQTVTIIAILGFIGVNLPTAAIVTNSNVLDFAITLFLITYAADMLSLLISCIAKNTTSAMTIMPFILMIQLVFSGGMFALPKGVQGVKNYMISNHGLACICSEAEYNELPSITGWKMLKKASKMENADPQLVMTVKEMEETGQDDVINMQMAKTNQKPDYEATYDNIASRWFKLGFFSVLFAFLSVLFLRRIDKDKR